MKREILFRGKRLCNSGWVEGFLIQDREFYGKPEHHSYIVNHSHPSGCFGGDIYFEVIPDTVGQYTGLTDKNGKRIFEGDIIKDCSWGQKIFKVEFDEGRGGWYPFACGDGCGCCENEVACTDYSEVIGNIHDNPELIAEVEG